MDDITLVDGDDTPKDRYSRMYKVLAEKLRAGDLECKAFLEDVRKNLPALVHKMLLRSEEGKIRFMDLAEEGTLLRRFQDWAGRIVGDPELGPLLLFTTSRDLSMSEMAKVGDVMEAAEKMAKEMEQEGPIDQPNPELN